MEKLLKNIYYGNYYPAEKVMPECDEYRDISGKITELSKEFSEVLKNDEMKEKFEEYEGLIAESENLSNYEFFKEGFQLGVILFIEALCYGKK